MPYIIKDVHDYIEIIVNSHLNSESENAIIKSESGRGLT